MQMFVYLFTKKGTQRCVNATEMRIKEKAIGSSRANGSNPLKYFITKRNKAVLRFGFGNPEQMPTLFPKTSVRMLPEGTQQQEILFEIKPAMLQCPMTRRAKFDFCESVS